MDPAGTAPAASEAPPAAPVPAAPAVADGAPAAPPAAVPSQHDDHVDPASLPRIGWWSVGLALLVGAAGLWMLFRLGMGPRAERDAELDRGASSYDARPMVEVVQPRRVPATTDLRLPADLASMQSTSVFARANGYIRRLAADVGERVVAGQVLAEIDAPELDAQIVHAQASAALARANAVRAHVDLELADATFKRYTGFASTGGVTLQQLDEKRSAFEQATAAVGAAEASVAVADAEVRQLLTLQEFERVTAPFDGVVTARNFDVGALIGPAGASATKELFRVERIDVLRAFVNVPQAYAASAKAGTRAFISVRSWPGREFEGTLTRTAGVLDPVTRTLRCEIDVPNAAGVLYAGMYADLRLPATVEQPPLLVPTSAPTFGAAGATVWIVDGGHARARKVRLGRDFGTEIEVLDGLGADDQVVRNPGERLADGIELRAAPKTTAAAPAAAGRPEATR